MELTEKDKKLLLKWGYKEEDFKQIEDCMNNASFGVWKTNKSRHVTNEKALWYCGGERFLSGISRAAFHASAMRETRFKNISIYFSYAWWR